MREKKNAYAMILVCRFYWQDAAILYGTARPVSGSVQTSTRRWTQTFNENPTVYADEPFRVRFEVEQRSESTRQFRLQYRHNGSGSSRHGAAGGSHDDAAPGRLQGKTALYQLLVNPVSVSFVFIGHKA